MHLRFCMYSACDNKESRHPQEVMKSLGIDYQHATPQSVADQWWFWNCKNVPDQLPAFLTELQVDPMQCIGFGLNEELAKSIAAGAK